MLVGSRRKPYPLGCISSTPPPGCTGPGSPPSPLSPSRLPLGRFLADRERPRWPPPYDPPLPPLPPLPPPPLPPPLPPRDLFFRLFPIKHPGESTVSIRAHRAATGDDRLIAERLLGVCTPHNLVKKSISVKQGNRFDTRRAAPRLYTKSNSLRPTTGPACVASDLGPYFGRSEMVDVKVNSRKLRRRSLC